MSKPLPLIEFDLDIPDGAIIRRVSVSILSIASAEPDVGIMSAGADDFEVFDSETGEDLTNSLSDAALDLVSNAAASRVHDCLSVPDDELPAPDESEWREP